MYVNGTHQGAAMGTDPRVTDAPAEHLHNANVAMHQIASALVAVGMRDGKTLDLSYLAPMIAYHLALRGFRLHQDEALIKSRRVEGAQHQGALEWVGINAPDDVREEIDAATTPQNIESLSGNAKAFWIRQLGGVPVDDVPEGWRQKTRITFQDDEQTEAPL